MARVPKQAKADKSVVDEGGRSRQLGESEIVGAALKLTREVGLRRLTMRMLADELGVTPMAAYYYVPNKGALLDLVADAVSAKVEVPSPEAGDWSERLRLHAQSWDRELAAYPDLDGFMLTSRLTPNGWRGREAVLGIFLEAGFDERTAALAYAAWHTYLFGRTSIENQQRGQARQRPSRKSARQFPTTTSVALAARELRGDDYLNFGIDTLLRGFGSWLSAPQTALS